MFQNKTETTILKNNDPKKKVLIVIAWCDNAVIAAWSDLAQQSYISTFYQCLLKNNATRFKEKEFG